MSTAVTVRAERHAELVSLPSEHPVRFGVYECSKENARLYVRVVLCDGTIPPQSDVTGFHKLLNGGGLGMPEIRLRADQRVRVLQALP